MSIISITLFISSFLVAQEKPKTFTLPDGLTPTLLYDSSFSPKDLDFLRSTLREACLYLSKEGQSSVVYQELLSSLFKASEDVPSNWKPAVFIELASCGRRLAKAPTRDTLRYLNASNSHIVNTLEKNPRLQPSWRWLREAEKPRSQKLIPPGALKKVKAILPSPQPIAPSESASNLQEEFEQALQRDSQPALRINPRDKNSCYEGQNCVFDPDEVEGNRGEPDTQTIEGRLFAQIDNACARDYLAAPSNISSKGAKELQEQYLKCIGAWKEKPKKQRVAAKKPIKPLKNTKAIARSQQQGRLMYRLEFVFSEHKFDPNKPVSPKARDLGEKIRKEFDQTQQCPTKLKDMNILKRLTAEAKSKGLKHVDVSALIASPKNPNSSDFDPHLPISCGYNNSYQKWHRTSFHCKSPEVCFIQGEASRPHVCDLFSRSRENGVWIQQGQDCMGGSSYRRKDEKTGYSLGANGDIVLIPLGEGVFLQVFQDDQKEFYHGLVIAPSAKEAIKLASQSN